MKDLASRQRIRGKGGIRPPESLWDIRVIPPAKHDGARLFKNLSPAALVIAIEYARNLTLFPDAQPVVDGQLLDLDFERVEGLVFYRLRIDDRTFGNRSLRVFFWPQAARTKQAKAAGTIWVVGLAWRPDAYKHHMLSRCRRSFGRRPCSIKADGLRLSGLRRRGR